MKVALSGMVLGASMLGAQAGPLDGSATFTNGKTLSFSENSLSSEGHEVDCVKAETKGSAYHDGYDLTGLTGTLNNAKPATIDQHDDDAELAFFCGFTGESIVTFGGADQQGFAEGNAQQRVLIKFSGEYTDTDCDTGTISSSMKTDDNDGGRSYQPSIDTQVAYTCIKRHDFQSPEVRAALNVQRKSDAESFVADTIQVNKATLSRSSGTTYDKSNWQLTYNLGNDEPIAFYYEPQSCSAGSSPELCLGGIQTRADGTVGAEGALGSDFSTYLVTGEGWIQSPTYYKLSGTACLTRDVYTTPQVSQKDACGLTKVSATDQPGGEGMLTVFDCPFRTEDYTVSSEAHVDECLALGAGLYLNNLCDSRDNYDQSDQVELVDPDFKVNLRFKDNANYHPAVPNPTLNTSSEYTNVPLGTASLDWVINLDASVAIAKGLRFVEVDDSNNAVADGIIRDMSDPSATQVTLSLPARDGSIKLQLIGTVQKTDCSNNDHNIGDPITLTASFLTGMQSEIRRINACSDFFEVTGDLVTNPETVTKLIGKSDLLTTANVQFCDPQETVADCRAAIAANPPTNPQTSTSKALVSGVAPGSDICDGIRDGDVAAVVEFGSSHNFVPIYCSAACATKNLADIKLDWDIQFDVSLQEGDLNNYLTATEASSYGGEMQGDQHSTFMAKDNLCNADGTVGTIPNATGCAIASLASATNANDIISKFQYCSQSSAQSPEVFLIQSYVITLKDGSTLEFCNAKKLSLQVENMQGTSQKKLVIASSTAAAATPIDSTVEFIGYRASQCSGGKQVLAVDILTNAPSATAGYLGTAVQFSSTIISNGKVTFETECIDICQASYADQYQLKAQLEEVQGDGQTRELDLTLHVEVDGTPCDSSPDALEQGDVELKLFGIAASDTDGCSSTTRKFADVKTNEDSVCASLTMSEFDSSTLKVLSETLTMKTPGSAAQVKDHLFFLEEQGTAKPLAQGDGEQNSESPMNLTEADAFAEYTLVINWEQDLGSRRRLLRSEHVFGAGDHESIASLVVLPASAQIQDAAESLDAATENAPAPAPAPAEEDEGLSGGAIAGIIAGGVVVAGGIAYVAMQARGSGLPVSRPQQAGYSVVRRSERFSTMNF